MKIIVIDFETYWDSKTYTLSKMNAIDYVRSPQFYAQLVSVSIDGKPAAVYEHDEIPAVLESLNLSSNDVITVGHNINGFDGLILSEVYNIHPAIILDTISMMRWTGVSRLVREQLKSLAEFFGVGDKKPGTVVSDGKRTKADFDSKDWEFFKQYCADDSNMTARCVQIMLPYMTTNSILFTSATAKMATDPGFYIDPKPLEKYIAELDAGVREARENLNHLFNFANDDEFMKAIRSDAQFCSMLKLLGQEPPMKVSEKKTETYKKKLEGERLLATPERVQVIDTILADPDQYTIMTPALSKGDLPFVELLDSPDERVRLLVQARLDHKTSVPRSRAEGLLHFAGTKPVPVMLKCFSAHTSRYAAGALDAKSDGIQWQNIPKHNKSMEALRKSIVVFDDSFTVIACDSSQIEARVLAYVAQQLDLLDHFAHGRDIYAEQAAAFGYGMSAKEIHDGAKSGNKEAKMLRQVGKKLILSCLSADTEVLTEYGWKRIVDVSLTDRLWDGESWTSHSGVICNGWKTTVELDGIRLTPNHLIFNGSSWNTAKELVENKQILTSATLYATEKLLTLGCLKILGNKKKFATKLNVSSAIRNGGVREPVLCEQQGDDAIAVMFPITKQLKEKIQYLGQKLVRFLVSLQSSDIIQNSVYQQRGLSEKTVTLKHVVPAGKKLLLHGQIYDSARQPDVMIAGNVKAVLHNLNYIGVIVTSAQTQKLDGDCLTGLRTFLGDAITLSITNTIAMVGGVLNAVLRIDEVFFHILSHLKGIIIYLWRLTGLTIQETTKLVISVLQKNAPMLITDVQCLSILNKYLCYANNLTPQMHESRNSKTCYEPVYDILNCGKNNRFTVRTEHGALIVHNCGYGTGWRKFADTLLREHTPLSPNKDEHYATAKKLHTLYRSSNKNIVYFWDTCQRVIEAMARGEHGFFGGADNALFEYGPMTVCGRKDVPSIKLPTGFILRYPNLRLEYNDAGKGEYIYDRILGKSVIPTRIYGGALTENCVQSLAFQILMDQAVEMINRGVKIYVNVHDSFSTIVPNDDVERTRAIMEECMSAVPSYVKGLPLACESEIAKDFSIC